MKSNNLKNGTTQCRTKVTRPVARQDSSPELGLINEIKIFDLKIPIIVSVVCVCWWRGRVGGGGGWGGGRVGMGVVVGGRGQRYGIGYNFG